MTSNWRKPGERATREGLARLFAHHVHAHDGKCTDAARRAIEDELETYFASPEGQAHIASGPVWHRNRSPRELARLLASEAK